MRIFDTHAHYDSSAFASDRDEILTALPQAGVELVVDPGCDVESSRAALALAERYPHVYAAVGLHPEDCAGAGEAELEEIRRLCGHEKAVAIGEIGLDYYWAENPPRPFQQEIFRRQLALAQELDMPVIVHDREAHGDTMELLRQYRPAGVVHCYSGSAEMAKEVLSLGMYVGFTGVVTFKNARKALEAAEVVPLDRLLRRGDAADRRGPDGAAPGDREPLGLRDHRQHRRRLQRHPRPRPGQQQPAQPAAPGPAAHRPLPYHRGPRLCRQASLLR